MSVTPAVGDTFPVDFAGERQFYQIIRVAGEHVLAVSELDGHLVDFALEDVVIDIARDRGINLPEDDGSDDGRFLGHSTSLEDAKVGYHEGYLDGLVRARAIIRKQYFPGPTADMIDGWLTDAIEPATVRVQGDAKLPANSAESPHALIPEHVAPGVTIENARDALGRDLLSRQSPGDELYPMSARGIQALKDALQDLLTLAETPGAVGQDAFGAVWKAQKAMDAWDKTLHTGSPPANQVADALRGLLDEVKKHALEQNSQIDGPSSEGARHA